MSKNTTNIPIGYKNTTIGIIPNDWEVKSIEKSVQSISIPYKYQTKEYLHFGKYPIVDQGKNQYVGFSDNENHLIKDIPLVLFGDHTKNVKYINHPFCVGADGTKLLKSSLISSHYLFYLISQATLRLPDLSYSRHFTELKNIQLPIPPLPEQQKIAEILSTWDEAITNCKTTINTLKDRNKGLAQQLHSGKKRLSGFSERWEVKKIKDFSMDVSIKNKNDDDLVVLSCTKHNGLVPSLEYFGRKIYSDNLKTYKIVEKNVFAYATNHIEEGSIGYQSKYEKALISPMYTVFKTDDDINDEFLFRLLKSNTYIQEYQKRMEGSIDRRGGLRWQEFSKIKVSVPSYEEQTAIALALETADQELKSYETKLVALQLQKKGLMQQLLTGKIRVNVK